MIDLLPNIPRITRRRRQLLWNIVNRLSALDTDNLAMLIFLDQSAAADGVDDYKRLQRLQRSYGVGAKVLIDWFTSYLGDRIHQIHAATTISSSSFICQKTQIHHTCSFLRSAANIDPRLVPTGCSSSNVIMPCFNALSSEYIPYV